MAFDANQFMQQNFGVPLEPDGNTSYDTLPTEEQINTPSSGFDTDSFLKNIQANAHLPNPAEPESSYGETTVKALQNAYTGLKGGLGGFEAKAADAPKNFISDMKNNPNAGDVLSLAASLPVKGFFDAYNSLTDMQPDTSDIDTSSSTQGRQIYNDAQKQLQSNQPNVPEGGGKYYAHALTQGAAQLAVPLAATLMTRNPLAGELMFGAQGSGDTYGQQIAGGTSPQQANHLADVMFLVNAGAGRLPLGVITEEGGGILAKTLKGAGAGAVANDVITTVQSAIDKGTISPNMTLDDYWQKLKEATGMGAILGATGGVVAHPFTKGSESTAVPPAEGGLGDDKPNILPEHRFNKQTGRVEEVVPGGGNPTPPGGGGDFSDRTLPTIAPEIFSPQDSVNIPLRAVNADPNTIYQPTSEQLQSVAGRQVSDNIINDFQRQSSVPLLDYSSTGNQNIDAARDLRKQSLDSLLNQIKDAAIPRNADDTKSITTAQTNFTKAVNDYYLNNKMVEGLKSKIPNNEQPIIMGRESDVDTFKNTFDAIVNKDMTGLNSNVVHDMIDNGYVKINNAGYPEITNVGKKLHTELNNAQPLTQEQPKAAAIGAENRAIADQNASASESKASPVLESATPEEEKAIADYQNAKQQEVPFSVTKKENNIIDKRKFLENSKITKDSNASDLKLKEYSSTTPVKSEKFGNTEFDIKKGESQYVVYDKDKLIASYDGDNIIVDPKYRRRGVATDLVAQYHSDHPDVSAPKYLTKTSKEVFNKAIDKINSSDVINKTPFSITPIGKFIAQKDQLKAQLTNIIKRINPDVKTEFADRLFGEGEAIKASGGKTAARQEVAGSFDRMKNLISASLNTEKWNPLDTAYHEAYHSIRDMVTPADDAVLKKAFPGTDKLSQPEHEAVEFGRFMTEKNATGFAPSVRRVFSSIRQALRDIGRTLKLGKFNSVEDIFNRAERGSVYSDYQRALKSGDVESLKSSNLTPEQQEQAIKEVSLALHEIVYSATPKDDMEALKDVSIQAHGTPEEKAQSIGNQIYDGASHAIDGGIEKMLNTAADVLAKNPFLGEHSRERLREDINLVIQKTKYVPSQSSLGKMVESWARTLKWSAENHMRWMGDSHGVPEANIVADHLYNEPGKTTGLKDMPFGQMREYLANNWKNTLARSIKEEKLTPKDLNKVAELMQFPERTEGMDTKKGVAKVALQAAKIVQDIRDAFAKAGRELPEVNNFFPRIEDISAIMGDIKGFKEQRDKVNLLTYGEDWRKEHDGLQSNLDRLKAKEEIYQARVAKNPQYAAKRTEAGTLYGQLSKGRQTRISNIEKNYDPDVEQYIKNKLRAKTNTDLEHLKSRDLGIRLDNGKFSPVPVTGDIPSSLKQRVLVKEREDLERKYLIQNPYTAIFRLADQAATNLAWEHHFGNGKWEAMERKMVDQGADGDFLTEIRKDVAAVTGIAGQMTPRTTKTLASLARYILAVGTLPKAVFVHGMMPFLTGIQAGNPLRSLGMIHGMMRETFNGNGDKARAVKDYAEMLGFESEDAERAQLMNNTGMHSWREQKFAFWMYRFFRGNGISSFMRNFNANQYGFSGLKVQKLAEDIVDHNDNYGGKYKSSQYFMEELGIAKEDVKPFAEWVTKTVKDGGNKASNAALANRNDPMAQMFHRVVVADAKMTSLAHDSAVMPRWANAAEHPFLSIAYAISHYKNNFAKNVLMRSASLADEGLYGLGGAAGQAIRGIGNFAKLDLEAGKQSFSNAKETVTGNLDKGYSALDRTRFLMPAMQLPLLYLYSMGYKALYNAWTDSKEKTPLELQALQRSDIAGDFQPIINAVFGQSFDAKRSILGPGFERTMQYYDFIFRPTNNHERQMQRAWSLVVAPTLTAATTTLSPFGVPTTAALTTAINSPEARDAFVDLTK